ncbi:DDE-type integrase/transposase/recombinase [Mycolicibacterium sp. 018/SC-01/001]|uniref:Mu transposase C-terminal domain-containing protein n=1 Tax=Mycolicibacterium sp. 018/SC-01/001 TaxID=2592069 RepID=UPI00117E374F|nr:Mu transposase C-terminal domain-containing protein [Mycolicibacterium sp. 018/SC-01/001]TRW80997.1 DDE-type integrase/transposase/recombinase [Mycolicibacterium sp. 018/SC-01/001]
MRPATTDVRIGTRFFYDGEMVEVVEMHCAYGDVALATKDVRSGALRQIALSEVMSSDNVRLLDDGREPEIPDDAVPAAVIWGAVSESERHRARERASHVREVLTGYRSGSARTASAMEPRAAYRSNMSRTDRVSAKARELRCGVRTVQRWVAAYLRDGEAGLISGQAARIVSEPTRFAVFERIALDIMVEHTDSSRPSKQHIIAQTRARITATYGRGSVPLPGRARAYEILDMLERRHPIFQHSSKRNRDIAARPVQEYGALHPGRPGEYVLMDTTRLDVFAMDPQTLRWTSVELTVAMDWYSRCITGLRLTPGAAKAFDAATVLYQCLRPAPAGKDWPVEAVWPPHGIPRSVLIEADAVDADSVFAASPAIVPETVVVDHGRIYVGEALTSACRQAGISIQPARVRTGRDKGPVERFFRTVREGFLQELPGYKGPDVYSRGLSPESEAYFFLDELEALLREWVACVYHRRPHDGVGEPGLWSLGMSPVQMFEHGIARAGYLQVPRDPDLAYRFLPVVWRTVQHYGVEVNGRVYRGSVLVDYVGTKSPFAQQRGRWPFQVNPDDIRQIFFFDLQHTRRWHPLSWTRAAMLTAPMNEDGLAFARRLAKAKHPVFDDQLALAELLERRNLTQGRSPAERRAALRVCREQSSLEIDLAAAIEVSALPTAQRVLAGVDPTQAAAEEAALMGDDLDDTPLTAGVADTYDDVLEDL